MATCRNSVSAMSTRPPRSSGRVMRSPPCLKRGRVSGSPAQNLESRNPNPPPPPKRPLGPDEPGELCQKPSHNRTDDREVTRLGELLHLREDGIPVRNEAVKVGLDVRSEHLRGHHSKGFFHPSDGKQTMG